MGGHMYYLYLLRCQGDTLYAGITTELDRRMKQHRGELAGGAKYTAAHPQTELAAAWAVADRAAASRLEWAVKRLPRSKKEGLIARPEQLGIRYPEIKSTPVCLEKPD